jgi:DNA ligase-1
MTSFTTLVEVSKKVASTTSKKEKISLLAQLLRQTRGKEISLAASYLSGQIPQGRLGIGWGTLQQALQDLPDQTRSLSLVEIDSFFERISEEKGKGSSAKKIRLLRDLFSSIRRNEADFLTGLIMGEIRQGALEGLVLEAVAQASSLDIERLRQGLMFSGEIGEVSRIALEEGMSGLSKLQPRLFHPISPMLANPAESEAEALGRLGKTGWEFKIDGARIQVHKESDEVRIYTRHLKDITESIPEIVQLARKLRLDRAIFEGEVIALREDGKPQPFQTIMRRFGRIQGVEKMKGEIPIIPFFFDLLYLDGESLLDEPYWKRFELLSQRVLPEKMIPRIVTAKEPEAQDFLKKSLQAGHEGLMAKGFDSPYQAGHRGFFWLKIKPIQTLDLLVLAGEWGHGRRKGWLSNLHLGARDPESNNFIMLGKTFKGLTDEMLRWQTKRLLELEISRDQWTVYVRPELIVEVAFNDIQESPRYPGGVALRFARVRRYREDKSPLEVDTIQKVWQIFEGKRR